MQHYRTDLQRRLRQEQTASEARLWELLRGRRLGAKFRRQHPVQPYVADFACVEARLVVELDGGVHRLRETEDFVRQQTLEAAGWRVLRVANEAVWGDLDGVVELIRAALRRAPSP